MWEKDVTRFFLEQTKPPLIPTQVRSVLDQFI